MLQFRAGPALQRCWFHCLGGNPEAKVSPFKNPHPHLGLKHACKQCLCHLYQRRSLFMQAQQRCGRWQASKCQVLAKTRRHCPRSWSHAHRNGLTSNVSEWCWRTANFKLPYPQSLGEEGVVQWTRQLPLCGFRNLVSKTGVQFLAD